LKKKSYVGASVSVIEEVICNVSIMCFLKANEILPSQIGQFHFCAVDVVRN